MPKADVRDLVNRGRIYGSFGSREPTEASFEQRAPDELYTHEEYVGRSGETPAEATLRNAYNDHGRALEAMQRETGPGPANPTPVVNKYPLDQDGDEDK